MTRREEEEKEVAMDLTSRGFFVLTIGLGCEFWVNFFKKK